MVNMNDTERTFNSANLPSTNASLPVSGSAIAAHARPEASEGSLSTAANPGCDLRDITRPRAFNRDTGARKGLSMRGEAIRELGRKGRPGSRASLAAGPPQETSAHATPCSKRAVHAPQNANAPAGRPGRSLSTCWRASFADAS